MRTTWKVAVIPDFLDSLFQREKSGEKGEAYASDVAFLQKFSGEHSTFSEALYWFSSTSSQVKAGVVKQVQVVSAERFETIQQ